MIVISGASGFIGRRLAARFVAEHPDADVRCLVRAEDDAFGESGTEFLRSRSIHPIPTDLVSGHGLENLRSPEVLFHLAANTHTWEADHRCNDIGTQNLLKAVQPLGPQNHVVFTGTVAVMDNRKELSKPAYPDSAIEGLPLSDYGRTKWRAEQFLRAQAKERGFRLSVARLCTVYGPDPRPNSFFTELQRQVAKRTAASRLNWPGLTSFIHVDDVVNCLLRIADDPPPPGEPRTYLLATESRTLRDVARLVYRVVDAPYRPVVLPDAIWNLFRTAHWLCRYGRACLPTSLFNPLWRVNLVVNPAFHCDTEVITRLFPDLRWRQLEEAIHEICSPAFATDTKTFTVSTDAQVRRTGVAPVSTTIQR